MGDAPKRAMAPSLGLPPAQLALLQRRVRADLAEQARAAHERVPAPKDGAAGAPPEHQWDGPRLRFRHPGGAWGAWVDLRPLVPVPKDGEDGKDGEPGKPPAHQWSGSRLRFQRPDGGWGAWVDLRGKAVAGGGGYYPAAPADTAGSAGALRLYQAPMQAGVVDYPLPSVPLGGVVEVFINGVRVSATVSGVNLTVTGYTPGTIESDDELAVYYQE